MKTKWLTPDCIRWFDMKLTQNHSISFMYSKRCDSCVWQIQMDLDDCWNIFYYNWEHEYQPNKWTIRRYNFERHHFSFNISHIRYQCHYFCIRNRALVETIGKIEKLNNNSNIWFPLTIYITHLPIDHLILQHYDL